MIMSEFSENLKQARIARDWSQKQLAEAMGLHATHVSRYERGLASPNVEVVRKLADVLKVSADRLIYGSELDKMKNQIGDIELFELFSEVAQFEGQDIDAVKAVLRAFVVKNRVRNINI